MSSEIREIFANLEEKYRQLRQHLDQLPAGVLSFKAGPDKWSIVEAVEHLVLAEENMVKQFTGGASTGNLDPRDRSAKNYHIVIKVMTEDILVDVPDESMEPRGRFSLKELLERWEATRQKIRAHIDALDTGSANELVYRHPFAGPLNLAETLRFIDVHFDNHMRHLEKIESRSQPAQSNN